MSLTLITPPAMEPVSLDEVKAHLRVASSGEDAAIASLAVAARQTVEARLGLAMIAQGWRLALDHPPADVLSLPLSPLASVDAVSVNLADGGAAPIDPDDYDVAPGRDGRLRLLAPTPTSRKLGAFVVDFTAGWADADEVPFDLKLAVKLLAAHFFENREGAGGEAFYAAPEGVRALIAPWRRVRL